MRRGKNLLWHARKSALVKSERKYVFGLLLGLALRGGGPGAAGSFLRFCRVGQGMICCVRFAGRGSVNSRLSSGVEW
jgi:hypothetical protein